ncbi:uncharacterized protein STEHIDRAFT_55982 [Stereum hirsutum FP-91666 SS1]|uniref:uncharacterized protein n=1 Tax=Stereum hirsutum (strain FP-91666) TaxID=721885 RepID=UPI000440AFC5|nr:uncharacterized protein STEHIDRAFT_55982 [Stereum hirsutum FP-91666 SS1]EIM87101.1 hypothetical protein STEHIDRAFT_55982 [Stereum hirsutum FP-91666 SS1]
MEPFASEKSPSRLNQRSFGVTNRIWLILSLFLAILLFTRFALPSSSTDSYYSRSLSQAYTSKLKPTNYLNVSAEVGPYPFEFCPTFGPGDELAEKYGALAISKSWLHLGSGARVQKVVHRALLGQPVTISVIGGSVSACHGAGDDPISPTCYPSRFFDWWNTVFPHPASELTNGAMRRTGSEYFSFCSAHHLPDYTDLVVVELDTEDKGDKTTLENFELLIRSILLRPDSPAIIILGHFSPQVHTQSGFAGPDHWHSVVSQFYDVPHISTKAFHYPAYILSPPSIEKHFADPVLANPSGHSILADTLISYIQSQICATFAAATGRAYEGGGATLPVYYALNGGSAPGDAKGLFGGKGQRKGSAAGAPDDDASNPADRGIDWSLGTGSSSGKGAGAAGAAGQLAQYLKVPQSRIASVPEDLRNRGFQEIATSCVSANDLINPLPLSIFLGSGWEIYHPSSPYSSSSAFSSFFSSSYSEPSSESAQHYWYATMPTSRLRIPLSIGAGDVGVYYVREPRAVVGEGAAVECWVDDNYGGARVLENVGEVGEAEVVLQMIDHYVARGAHFVECQLLGEEGQEVPPFRIVGFFTT